MYWRLTKLYISIMIVLWENTLADYSLLITLGTTITLYALLTFLIDAPVAVIFWYISPLRNKKQSPNNRHKHPPI